MQFMFSRKSGIVLAALLGVQLILPASGWALTGRDVALKADQVDTSRTSDMSMAMIIKRGDQQHRVVHHITVPPLHTTGRIAPGKAAHPLSRTGGHPEYGLSHVELQGYQQRR